MIAGKWRLLDGIEPIKAGDKSLDGFGWTTLTEADEGLAASCFLLVKRPMTPAEEHAEELLEAANALRAAAWAHVRAVEQGMSRSAVEEAARHTRHAISRAEDLVAKLFPA